MTSATGCAPSSAASVCDDRRAADVERRAAPHAAARGAEEFVFDSSVAVVAPTRG
jgi:hypothetical protein